MLRFSMNMMVAFFYFYVSGSAFWDFCSFLCRQFKPRWCEITTWSRVPNNHISIFMHSYANALLFAIICSMQKIYIFFVIQPHSLEFFVNSKFDPKSNMSNFKPDGLFRSVNNSLVSISNELSQCERASDVKSIHMLFFLSLALSCFSYIVHFILSREGKEKAKRWTTQNAKYFQRQNAKWEKLL